MCLGCNHQRKWQLELEMVGEEGKIERYPYKVEVKTDSHGCCGCCENGVHVLTVNKRIQENQIFDNICFPLCFSGGAYEWEEKGHFFRLELPSLFIHDGLYVDGKEIDSQRQNTSEWNCQFTIWLVLGCLVITLGIAFILLWNADYWKGFLYLGISSLLTGGLTVLPGIIGCCRAHALGRQYQKMKQQKAFEKDLTTHL